MKYSQEELCEDIRYISEYLLNNCVRDATLAKKIYAQIEHDVVAEVTAVQGGRKFHIGDTAVANILGAVLIKRINNCSMSMESVGCP